MRTPPSTASCGARGPCSSWSRGMRGSPSDAAPTTAETEGYEPDAVIELRLSHGFREFVADGPMPWHIPGLNEAINLLSVGASAAYDDRDFKAPTTSISHPLNYQFPGRVLLFADDRYYSFPRHGLPRARRTRQHRGRLRNRFPATCGISGTRPNSSASSPSSTGTGSSASGPASRAPTPWGRTASSRTPTCPPWAAASGCAATGAGSSRDKGSLLLSGRVPLPDLGYLERLPVLGGRTGLRHLWRSRGRPVRVQLRRRHRRTHRARLPLRPAHRPQRTRAGAHRLLAGEGVLMSRLRVYVLPAFALLLPNRGDGLSETDHRSHQVVRRGQQADRETRRGRGEQDLGLRRHDHLLPGRQDPRPGVYGPPGWATSSASSGRARRTTSTPSTRCPTPRGTPTGTSCGPMTLEELAEGPGAARPDESGPWEIVAGKFEGITAGFTIKDASGRYFLLKFDSKGNDEMGSGSEVVVTKVLHAAGYNVPRNSVVFFDPARLEIGPKARVSAGDGEKRPHDPQGPAGESSTASRRGRTAPCAAWPAGSSRAGPWGSSTTTAGARTTPTTGWTTSTGASCGVCASSARG